MSIVHHLPDPILMAYAAGNLPEAFSLVVATHVSLCDDCRARLQAFEAVGGTLLDQTDAPPVSDAALAATMQLIATREKDPIRSRMPASAVFPAPLRDYVGGDLDAVRWRSVAGGVRQSILASSKSGTVRLLHIPAGAAMPDHGHRGTEMTMVLTGAFRDADGLFARGDVEVATEATSHTPVAEPGEDCVCLAATDAPLRFSGLIPRIVQPFFRI
jgi:putative transcriptional regulator